MTEWISAHAAVQTLGALPVVEARGLLVEQASRGLLPARATIVREEIEWWMGINIQPYIVGSGHPPVGNPVRNSRTSEYHNALVLPEFFASFPVDDDVDEDGTLDWPHNTFTRRLAGRLDGETRIVTAVNLQFDGTIVSSWNAGLTMQFVNKAGRKSGPLHTFDWHEAANMLFREALKPDGFDNLSDRELREMVQEWFFKHTGKRPGDTSVTNYLSKWGITAAQRQASK